MVGLVLRVAAPSGRSRQAVCSLCLATHTGDGVSLMTAPRAGRSGRQGDSVGAYVCTDLGCSAHVRGRGRKGGPPDVETMSTEDKVTRLRGNLEPVPRPRGVGGQPADGVSVAGSTRTQTAAARPSSTGSAPSTS
ncbi:hypothetical protein GCM10025868_16060 [Angustibacter aerolatus]|uniref:Elongation factor G-binding protein C-terminal treble-clef zinc-finger domain-containing protein n=1 Tax=Angustibacter aerolatus TaxID=1162965 RepID=A0ABQ6JFL9_9ACTN|nr:hypothetical protein GCM10025868_16060 [Angustibacter aerolatus]